MTGIRRRAAVVGTLLVAFGIVATAAPGIAAPIPSTGVLAVAVGVVAILLGIRSVRRHLGTREDSPVEIPAVETRTAARVPGEAFDRDLAERDPRIRDRVERTALRAIARRENCSDERARRRLEAGDWTPDRSAAAFLSSSVDPGTATGARIRAAVAGRSPENPVAQARRAVEAVADRAGLDAGGTAIPSFEDVSPTRFRAGGIRTLAGRPRTDGGDPNRTGLPRPGESVDRATGRWRGVGGLALIAAGVGTVLNAPAPLLLAAVGGGLTAYGAYGRAGDPPTVDLAVEREVDPVDPDPGESVSVAVTVRNEGEATLQDLRYVDGVPAALVVSEGTPRLDARLAPGETAECAYELAAETGRHSFEPSVAIARDRTGCHERVRLLRTDDELVCRIPSETEGITPRAASLQQTGRVGTDVGGTGVEFYGTREYRRGDPVALIDWNRYAATGELSTVQFREERSAAVVVVVDARPEAYRAADPGGRSAVRHSAEAAARLFEGFLDGGDLVGLAALSAAEEELWLPPGGGRDHRVRARELLSTHPAVAPAPPDRVFVRSEALDRLRSRLPGGAQVLLVSPLSDDAVAEAVRTLEAGDCSVSVLSPDPTATDTPGRLLASSERHLRAAALRATGVPVLDWDPADPLALALERAARRRGSA